MLADAGDVVPLRSAGLGMAVIGRGEIRDWAARGSTMLIPGFMLRPDWGRAFDLPADTPPPRFLLARHDPAWWEIAHERIAGAYGLADMERAVLAELSDHGDADRVAADLGVDRIAVRNALVRLRAKLGVRNSCELIGQSILLVAGPGDRPVERTDEQIAECLSLKTSHFAVLREIIEGRSRQEVSAVTGRSIASIKAILATCFQEIGVTSASQAACVIGQARLTADWLLAPAQEISPWGGAQSLKICERPDGRRIGYSLYGKGSGPVAAILHSTITCRHPPTRFVRCMLERGWRVLAVDRPGFGQTSTASASDIDMHVRVAAEDLEAVVQAEGISHLTLVARGSGQMAIALADILGPLVARLVLVNPTPAIAHTPVDRGPLGAIKRRFARSPDAIRVLIGLLLRVATPQRLEASMRRAFAGSPVDLAGLDDRVLVDDYLAATLPLRENLDGYVVENSAWARGWEPTRKSRGFRSVMVLGTGFVLHEPGAARAYFRNLLPDIEVREVANAGQMLIYTHPEDVAELVGQDVYEEIRHMDGRAC